MALDIGAFVRPSRELIEGINELSSPTVLESLKGKFNMHSEIKPFWPGVKLVGSALTVRCQVGDNLTLHKAVELLQPGDVIVADAGGYKETGGMWGEIMALAAQKRGGVGLVIDGAVRDIPILRQINFPVFARTASPGSTAKKTFGSIGRPITCGGVLVNPGDIIVGDESGVLVIPAEKAAEVLELTIKIAEAEDGIEAALRQGLTLTQAREKYHYHQLQNKLK